MSRSSVVKYKTLKIYSLFSLCFTLICVAQISASVTSPSDVAAINNLYVSLGMPVLPGWVASGGDPCAEAWQGVACMDSNIITITLNAANLGGELGENWGLFTALTGIDLSNNHIGGSIPSNLPVTLKTLFLSANQITGSIPDSLSTLTQLSAMSLNSNLLTGEIPDAFVPLAGLVNLDISSNNFSGQLPPSLGSLPSLTTLHLQNNQLSGTLDVLQDLPLRDLNIENNKFAGPIPEKLLSIPSFKMDGNSFNSTIAPVLPPTSPTTKRPPAPPFFGPSVPSAKSPPSPGKTHPGTTVGQAEGPSVDHNLNSGKAKKNTTRIVWIVIAAVLSFIVLVLGLMFCISKCTRRRVEVDRVHTRHETGAHKGGREAFREDGPLALPATQMGKVAKEAVVRPKENDQKKTGKIGAALILQNNQERNAQRRPLSTRDDHEIDMNALDMMLMPPPPPPPPPPFPSVEKVTVEPVAHVEVTKPEPSTRILNPPITARYFTIASLQQYTNSFSPENIIGEGMLGKVYRAEFPDGKLLAVKKLDKTASSQLQDSEFLELVNALDKIRHANVVELMGYSAEHGERLLVYEYCSGGSLLDALHADDDLKRQLPWNSRVRMALGAARALEYLHEVYYPPIIHRNFKAANVLLDDDLSVRVSDCGLAPLITSRSVSQLSGHLLTAYGYGAPEFESGIYTIKSDVYSFGVVMLELLTGRKSYDRTRNRGEQFLVRWAIPQLHDIDALSEMVDPSLNGEYPAKSLSNFADIISRCVQTEPEFRPQMSEVVQDLLEMIRREPCSSR